MIMSPKKVDLKESEYQEVYAIFNKLFTAESILPIELFKKNLDIFFDLTFDSYAAGNMGSNKEAMTLVD